MALKIDDYGTGVGLSVYIQPRSSVNQLVGLHESALKIKLTAPPVEDAANRQLVEFLAKYLDVAKSRIQVIKGGHSRRKQVRIENLTPQQLMEKLREVL